MTELWPLMRILKIRVPTSKGREERARRVDEWGGDSKRRRGGARESCSKVLGYRGP